MPDVYNHFEGTLHDGTPFEVCVYSRHGVHTFPELREALRGERDLVYGIEVTVLNRNTGGWTGGHRASSLVRARLLDDNSGVVAIHRLGWNTSTGPPDEWEDENGNW
jgi:hypothetical protein